MTEDLASGLLLVAITERVVPLCDAVLAVAYAEYGIWYVSADIICFARELFMDMADPLGCQANVHEVLKIIKIFEKTRFELRPTIWGNRTSRSIHHHVGQPGVWSHFIYYYLLMRRKIYEVTARSRPLPLRVVPVDFQLAGGTTMKTSNACLVTRVKNIVLGS